MSLLRSLLASGLLLLAVTILAGGGTGDGVGGDAYDRAIAGMDRDPAAAEAAMRGAGTPLARLDLLLYLHAFRPDGRQEIAALAHDLATLPDGRTDDYMLDVLGPPLPYDGTDESLLPLVRLLSSTGAVNSHSAFYAIPCAVLARRPGLLAATQPQFAGNRDNFLPRSGCDWNRGTVTGFPDAAMTAFMEAGRLADGDFLGTHGGTLRFALGGRQAALLEQARLDPAGLPPAPPGNGGPYAVWAYLSPANHRAFIGRIQPSYAAARAALTAYYRPAHGQEAEQLARNALFAVVWGGDCGEAGVPSGHARTLLLDDAPADAVRAAMEAGNTDRPDDAFARCARWAGIDPLSHLAAARRPDLLPDMVSGNGPDMPNGFGKTPLMAAAQADQPASVAWLLDQGARVDAATAETGPYDAPRHGKRTALHYAAANAGLPVIRALLAAGADPGARDDEGLTPLDYLRGNGPVPVNPRLATGDRDQAGTLLSPDR
ncbi:ankyrin repeat domain-containing protein [Niveispirillum fermenti]|uniref:ankyrin repeat domain-containing protein n=1 Tax=Niveispirillum fermenti TaxID=1233113 RepID=UPI003A8AA114